MAKKKTIEVNGAEIRILLGKEEDYMSLTDITKNFPDGKFLVPRWLRNRDTLSFLGTWEKIHNPNFRVAEFDNLYQQSGLNQFSLSITRWVDITGAIGVSVKRGKGATIFAHRDIALGFCYWLSPPFQLYLIKEFQKLKAIEAEEQKKTLDWSIKRIISKVNYKIQTEAIKQKLIPSKIYNRPKKEGVVYASEADLLNVALFGMTAREWRSQYPKKKGNMRDHASNEQLLVLANLESHNAQFIKEGLRKDERLIKLNEIAIYQMQILVNTNIMKGLK